jgi:hypothetical protein
VATGLVEDVLPWGHTGVECGRQLGARRGSSCFESCVAFEHQVGYPMVASSLVATDSSFATLSLWSASTEAARAATAMGVVVGGGGANAAAAAAAVAAAAARVFWRWRFASLVAPCLAQSRLFCSLALHLLLACAASSGTASGTAWACAPIFGHSGLMCGPHVQNLLTKKVSTPVEWT